MIIWFSTKMNMNCWEKKKMLIIQWTMKMNWKWKIWVSQKMELVILKILWIWTSKRNLLFFSKIKLWNKTSLRSTRKICNIWLKIKTLIHQAWRGQRPFSYKTQIFLLKDRMILLKTKMKAQVYLNWFREIHLLFLNKTKA